jgi:hypothetical protein
MICKEHVPVSLRGLRRRIRNIFSPIGTTFDPKDRAALEELALKNFRSFQILEKEPLGTIARGRRVLRLIEESFPIKELEAEYFNNLEHMFKNKKRRETAGQVLLGLGTGRSGSTSLTALLATIGDSCCTHENPPLIFWTPAPEQVRFHMRRFLFLVEYFALVSDVSHWWLNTLDTIFNGFKSAKLICLIRDVDECAKSFMRIRGYGWKSWNHWVPYGNSIWVSHLWDPTYPTYSIPANSSKNPDGAKYELIARYIRQYNAQLAVLAARLPGQVMLVRTEELNEPATQMRLFDFAGASGSVSAINLNVRSVIDAKSDDVKF